MPQLIPPNSHIRVDAGVAVGLPFTLPQTYRRPDGVEVPYVAVLSVAERIGHGLYPVVSMPPPPFDARWQTATPLFAVAADHVVLHYAIGTRPVNDVRSERIDEAYDRCRAILDGLSSGYAHAEIATWPAMQAEIAAYNADPTQVGPTMQAVIARGRHTAASMAAVLTPKMAIQSAALAARDAHVAAIQALTTAQAIGEYDITTGWPA